MTPAQFERHLKHPSLPSYCREVDEDCPLDRWISFAVKVLRDAGVETFESCQGGPGHSFHRPTIRFYGQEGAGYHAVAAALTFGLPVRSLRRYWDWTENALTGPSWEIVFFPASRLRKRQRDAENSGEIT